MFWGPERKDRLQQLIFGPRDTTMPNSKTQINGLHNMITLSADAHSRWAHGKFTLEPLGAVANPHELRARFQWTPRHSESPTELGIAADLTTIDLIPLTNGDRLVDYDDFSPIMDGHIVTFRSSDLVNASLPHRDLLMLQCFLIRVLRMAGRAGEDMLETFDTDDEVSLLATSSVGSSEEQAVPELAQSPPYHDGTTDLGKSPLAPSPDLGIDIATPLEQPPQEKRRRSFSSTSKLWSCLRSFLAKLHRKNGQNRTARLSTQQRIDQNRKSQRLENSMTKSLPYNNELTLQIRQKPVMASS